MTQLKMGKCRRNGERRGECRVIFDADRVGVVDGSLASLSLASCQESTCRIVELKINLLARGYDGHQVDLDIQKAMCLNRIEELKSERKKKNNKPVFETNFCSQVEDFHKIFEKNWNAMVKENPSMKRIFPEPPPINYVEHKTNCSLKNLLCRKHY